MASEDVLEEKEFRELAIQFIKDNYTNPARFAEKKGVSREYIYKGLKGVKSIHPVLLKAMGYTKEVSKTITYKKIKPKIKPKNK